MVGSNVIQYPHSPIVAVARDHSRNNQKRILQTCDRLGFSVMFLDCLGLSGIVWDCLGLSCPLPSVAVSSFRVDLCSAP